MAIALTLQRYLAAHDVDYDTVPHIPTMTSMHSAEASHVPGDKLAKAVVLKHDDGYMLAVIPASYRLSLEELASVLQRRAKLATEEEVERLFEDCMRGAVPPIGAAYGLDLIVDDSISDQPEIYFEGGDHGTLVHMSADRFARATAGAQHGRFSHHA
jgi:Ala-tRNA(Pro) deacylase